MSKNLIIFIDSFPYNSLNKTKFLASFPFRAKVIPGIGYSINVKAEMFGGYLPDEVGFFCEWMYSPFSPLREYRKLFQGLACLSRLNYRVDSVLHILVSKLLGVNIFKIPFKYLSYFQRTGINAYEDGFGLPTLFSHMSNGIKVVYSKYPFNVDRDKLLFLEAKEVILSDKYGTIFIASADLDHITHSFGIDSEEHTKKILDLDGSLNQICTLWLQRNPGSNIVIISDHGMANVVNSVTIDLEKVFGKIRENRYIYFVDSTFLRVWVFDEYLECKIKEYLSNLNIGRVLDARERKRYGITSRDFGSILFQLSEGIVFAPSFFGRRPPKAMHGYDSDLESQQGILLSLTETESWRERVNTVDVYSYLKRIAV